MTYLCDNGAMILDKKMVTDGTSRRHLGSEDLTAMTQLGTFAEYAFWQRNPSSKSTSRSRWRLPRWCHAE